MERLLMLALLLCGACEAQESKQSTLLPNAPTTEQQPSDKKVPVLTRRITLADFEGMKPKAEIREQVQRIAGFTQQTPNDGRPATQRTEVFVGRTALALYVVFACYDDHPKLIRGHLARRENILTDDTVSVLLDPFEDRRRGILFQVNPVGVQADAAWTDGAGEDYSYDQVWDSEGRVTKEGWMAMIAIPFRSLRFRPVSADWGVVFMRGFPRNSETDYWPVVTSRISGVLSQEGTLRGIEGVTGSHNVQVNPYVLGQNEKTLNTFDPFNPFFSQRTFEGTVGGEAKAILKDSIVFDATVNPDFSDVESDQPQFTVNQRFPVMFPELRSFFLENANYFSTPIDLVYTRNIVRPEYGARVTGKLGDTNIGVFAIDDREPGESVPVGDPLYGTRAGFFVGRVAQDIGEDLTIGATYTDEEFGGGWNRIGGLDFTWRATPAWTVEGQTVESSTMQSRPDSVAAVFPGGYSAGPASYVSVQRSGHAFNFEDDYTDNSTGFLSTTGFIETTDVRADHAHGTYSWFPKHGAVQAFGLEANQQVAFDHQGNRVYHYTGVNPYVNLSRNVEIAALFGENSDTLGPQDGYAIPQSINFTENYVGMVAKGEPWRELNFSVIYEHAGNVNYNPLPDAPPALLHQDFVQADVTVQPIRQLTIDNTYLLDRDFNAHDGQFVYESQTMRTKMNYQFTRAFSARAIVEYDSTLSNPLETALQRTKDVQTQALLTWLPHPGTAIYVGYNNDIQNYNHMLCAEIGGGCDPTQPILARGTGYLNDGRQFFVKISYLLRF